METTGIFEYQSYRCFLSDHLKRKKLQSPVWSQRYILGKMGITSSGFLSNVLAGRSNLTSSQVFKLSRILEFPKAETDFFDSMVRFEQTSSMEEKNDCLFHMNNLRKSLCKQLKPAQLSLFSKWYYAIIRELVEIIHFSGDYRKLAKLVDPPITAKQAKEAVNELLRMGLLTKGPDAVYRQADAMITTNDEVDSIHVARFQSESMEKARRAIEKIPAEHRDISVLTLTLSENKIPEAKKIIREFRKSMLRLAEGDSLPERVFQINTNFIPVTKKDNQS